MTLFTLVKKHFPKASSPHTHTHAYTEKSLTPALLKALCQGGKQFFSIKTPRPKHLSGPSQKNKRLNPADFPLAGKLPKDFDYDTRYLKQILLLQY